VNFEFLRAILPLARSCLRREREKKKRLSSERLLRTPRRGAIL